MIATCILFLPLNEFQKLFLKLFNLLFLFGDISVIGISLVSIIRYKYPAPAAAGAAPPKNQGNREARSAIYATVAVPIFDHVFFALPRGVPVSNCFNSLLRTLTKNSLKDRMSKFHLVKKWWDFENRDFGV